MKTIIDVRDEQEVEDFPDVFAGSTSVKYLHLPLVGNRMSEDDARKTSSQTYPLLHERYFAYLDHDQPEIAAIMGAVAESQSAILIHCHAGKDRTGLIAALLLGIAEVPPTLIAEDYAETTLQIAPLVAQWREDAVKRGQDMSRFERDAAAAPETMIATLDYLQQRYGGAANYLLRCGVTRQRLEQLSTQLVK